ncbi:trypsin-1-like [Eriocheir sinensis]|uniref:trypsin-1-like n=1 Tax=Eriocheir sinensis TaxID=95602 RepID=UPI0021C65E0D|nr:trypsin-1-like [Eriocheir sinensis]
MWSTNTHRRRGGILTAVVVAVVTAVMVASEEEVKDAANSYSPCVRPMGAKCEPESKLSDKIVGGHIAEPGSTPWLVSLQDTHYAEPVPFCGGTLLSHSWVLTSATCVYSYQKNYANIQVVLGEYNMAEIDGFERFRRLSLIMLHPDYDPYTHNADIAILRLSFYVLYSERIDVLKLPAWKFEEERRGEQLMAEQGDCEEDKGCGGNNNNLYTIAGWGRVSETGLFSSVVRKAQIPLVAQEICQEVYAEFTDTMICAGNLTHGGFDSCQGDMGGALATSDGYIIGVSSWSIGCGRPGYPGVYTDVTKMIDWICSVTDKSERHASDDLVSCRHD